MILQLEMLDLLDLAGGAERGDKQAVMPAAGLASPKLAVSGTKDDAGIGGGASRDLGQLGAGERVDKMHGFRVQHGDQTFVGIKREVDRASFSRVCSPQGRKS